MKVCRDCTVEKPLEEFVKKSAIKSGYGSRCLACERANSKRRYAANKEKKLAQNKAWRDKNPEYQAEYHARTRESRKEQRSAESRRYNEKNKEKLRQYHADYYQKNKERYKENNAKWRLENPEAIASASAKRRAAMRANFVESVDYVKVREQSSSCYLCGEVFSEEEKFCGKLTHVDHIIPISKGGSHSYQNVALTHAVCNLKKGSSSPFAPE